MTPDAPAPKRDGPGTSAFKIAFGVCLGVIAAIALVVGGCTGACMALGQNTRSTTR